MDSRIAVDDELAQALRARVIETAQHLAHRAQQQLERHEPLLAVNHLAHPNLRDGCALLLDHHGTQKVRILVRITIVRRRNLRGKAAEPSHSCALQVVPQQLPLLFFSPDIATLEWRHDVPNRAVEHVLQAEKVDFHGDASHHAPVKARAHNR